MIHFRKYIKRLPISPKLRSWRHAFYEPDLFLCPKPISLLFNLPLSMTTSSFLEFSTLTFSSAIGLIFYGSKPLHLLNSRLRRSTMLSAMHPPAPPPPPPPPGSVPDWRLVFFTRVIFVLFVYNLGILSPLYFRIFLCYFENRFL